MARVNHTEVALSGVGRTEKNKRGTESRPGVVPHHIYEAGDLKSSRIICSLERICTDLDSHISNPRPEACSQFPQICVRVCVCVKPRFQALEGACLCLNSYKSIPIRKVPLLTSTLLPHNYDGAASHAGSSHSLLFGTFPDKATSVLCACTTQYLATRGARLVVPRLPLSSRLHVCRGCPLLQSVPTCLKSPP